MRSMSGGEGRRSIRGSIVTSAILELQVELPPPVVLVDLQVPAQIILFARGY